MGAGAAQLWSVCQVTGECLFHLYTPFTRSYSTEFKGNTAADNRPDPLQTSCEGREDNSSGEDSDEDSSSEMRQEMRRVLQQQHSLDKV
mgnify:CR=1 FL=1